MAKLIRNKIAILSALVFLFLLAPIFGPKAFAQNYRGPFEGRVVDAATMEPIEGAVVFVEWTKKSINLAHPVSRFYDATEVLTNSNGEFDIPKKWSWNPLTNLGMDSKLIIFKAGYGHVETPWQPIKDAALILRKLPLDERHIPRAGCKRAVGDTKFILGCLTPEEQKTHSLNSFSEIRLVDESPIFLLKALPSIRDRSENLSRMILPSDQEFIPEILKREMKKDVDFINGESELDKQ